MRIRIAKNDNPKQLFVGITTGGVVGEELWFVRDGASEIERELLREHLIASLSDTFERIRKVSYLRGWRDAKSKKKLKQQWFACQSDMLDWEKREAGL